MTDDRQRVDPVESTGDKPTQQALARGRAAGTPFALLGSVATAIWSVLALVAGAVLVVWWLA